MLRTINKIVLSTLIVITSLDANSKEVLIIDKGVSDYQFFVDNAKKGIDIILLESHKDGLSQMTSTLKNYSNLEAIHIVSHGDRAKLFLGSSVVDSATLQNKSEVFKKIGASLSTKGDIFLYGCNVAQGKQGNSFVEKLSILTGADVAASKDITGPSTLGANWNLEVTKGEIKPLLTISNLAMKKYTGILVTTGTNDGTYDFGSVGASDSGGTGFKTQGDKFVISNAFSAASPVIYMKNLSSGTLTSSFIIKAENGATMKTFTYEDLIMGNYTGTTTLTSFSITFKDYTGNVLGTHSFNGSVDIGTSDTLVSSLSFSTAIPAGGYDLVSQVEVTYTTSAATNNYEFRSIKLSNINAIAAPSADSDATLTAAVTVSEPVTLDTTVDTVGEAVDLFDFTITDGGGGDSLATDVSQIVLHTSGTGDFSKVTWRLNGPDATNVTGTYNSG